MFMFIIGHNLRHGAVQELFHHSKQTISRYFNNVLNAIMSISLEFFQTPGPNVLPEISADPRFYPYFKDCVGAVDCIHIPVSVGVNEHKPFLNKNGLVSQLVLAACSLNLDFHYVLAGWEGSVSDMRVLNSALTRRNKLKMPEGRYYLVESKYANMPGFISPYPGVPYHSKEFPSGNQPQTAKELFNQRHSLLLNTSGRIFEALKMRFPILFSAPPYPLQAQVKLAVVLCALHNFIQRENPDDWLTKMHERDTIMEMEVLFPASDMDPRVQFKPSAFNISFGTEELEFSSQLRDSIVTALYPRLL